MRPTQLALALLTCLPALAQGEGTVVMARGIQVRFKAMSPVLLVHGIRDDGQAFEPNDVFPDRWAKFYRNERVGYHIFGSAQECEAMR